MHSRPHSRPLVVSETIKKTKQNKNSIDIDIIVLAYNNKKLSDYQLIISSDSLGVNVARSKGPIRKKKVELLPNAETVDLKLYF